MIRYAVTFKGGNIYKDGRTFKNKRYAEAKRRFMEEWHTDEFFVEPVFTLSVEEELKSYKKAYDILKKANDYHAQQCLNEQEFRAKGGEDYDSTDHRGAYEELIELARKAKTMADLALME